jgi:uncharacterized protein DUF6089
MKKLILTSFLFVCITLSAAAQWMGEITAGVMGYNGDLTESFSFKRFRPAVGFNLKYETGDFMNFRAGFLWGMLAADDKDNKDAGFKARNLSFATQLYELHVGADFNVFDPEIFTSYPYVFAELGAFYFNPYARDNDDKKVFLHDLSTEGQGLSEYPDRKPYSLIQFCIPFGLGWKWHNKNKSITSIEFGYRITFTDYLDDVSKTYVSPEILATEKGPKAAEMSYRKNAPFIELGEPRGSPGKKDIYFFGSFKYAFPLGKKK